MSIRVRRVMVMVIAVAALAGTTGATAQTKHGGPLSGSWSGYLGAGGGRQPMQITVNARETAGTWRISASCHGSLTLDSISYGYHHFRRHVAAGLSCAGGDVDCLKPAGAALYDAVTSHRGGAWDTSGMLKRVRTGA